MKASLLLSLGACALFAAAALPAQIKVLSEHGPADDDSAFEFAHVPRPAVNDAAAHASVTILTGDRDPNGGDVAVLHDGKLPRNEDQPSANFFFRAGAAGGRVLMDLGHDVRISQINSYSWHPTTRGPQVYNVYGAAPAAPNFDPQALGGADPASPDWQLIARVDTRPEQGQGGGQHGVSIQSPGGTVGSYRYLLFDIARTEDSDPFGNTFYSEIDVIDADGPEIVAVPVPEVHHIVHTYESEGGKYTFRIDTSAAPDLTEWADQELAPVVRAWYPKIVAMLPSAGYEAPGQVTIRFREDMGGTPAATGGSRISCNAPWFRRSLQGEARGAVVHELVHVVQNYGRARRRNPQATRAPGWLVEGIPDYIRWFLYEPETKGAEITRRNLARARYDASYRVTGNFLDWVTRKYDADLVKKLNGAARDGEYRPELWKDYTGKTLEELGADWRKAQEERLAQPAGSASGS